MNISFPLSDKSFSTPTPLPFSPHTTYHSNTPPVPLFTHTLLSPSLILYNIPSTVVDTIKNKFTFEHNTLFIRQPQSN